MQFHHHKNSLFCSSFYAKEETEQGSHSTEENLLTVGDLKNIFVDNGGGGEEAEAVLVDEEEARVAPETSEELASTSTAAAGS